MAMWKSKTLVTVEHDLTPYGLIEGEEDLSRRVFILGHDAGESVLKEGHHAAETAGGWMLLYGKLGYSFALGAADELTGDRLSRWRSSVSLPTYAVFTRHHLDCPRQGACECLAAPWWVEEAADPTVRGAVPVTPVRVRRRWLPSPFPLGLKLHFAYVWWREAVRYLWQTIRRRTGR